MANGNGVTIVQMGLLGLFLLFLGLKLTNVINWAWIWVFTPLWGIPALILGLCLFGLALSGLAWVTRTTAEICEKLVGGR